MKKSAFRHVIPFLAVAFASVATGACSSHDDSTGSATVPAVATKGVITPKDDPGPDPDPGKSDPCGCMAQYNDCISNACASNTENPAACGLGCGASLDICTRNCVPPPPPPPPPPCDPVACQLTYGPGSGCDSHGSCTLPPPPPPGGGTDPECNSCYSASDCSSGDCENGCCTSTL
jgi:hypothetical protein